MRRRNRRVNKESRFAAGSMGVAALIVSIFIMLMIYLSLDSRCGSISRDNGKAEKELTALEAELGRELTRWDEMKTTERLGANLTRFGLKMDYARPDQIVRVNADGRAAPGQLSVVRARHRVSQMAIARVDTGTRNANSRQPKVRR